MAEGKPCIRGLGIRVSTVIDLLASGLSTDEVLAELPGLTLEDVAQALAFQRQVDRRARAAARRRGMTVECFEGPPGESAVSSSTVAERIALTTELTRAAFLASVRELCALPSSEWPGEIFEIHDAPARRAP